jgi:hypothetical protein
MARLGVEGRPASSQEFASFVADEAPRWAEIVKASGVPVN